MSPVPAWSFNNAEVTAGKESRRGSAYTEDTYAETGGMGLLWQTSVYISNHHYLKIII